MGLQVPEPPKQGMDIVRDALSSAVNQPGVAASALAEVATETLSTAAPHQIYSVSIRDVAEGHLLSCVQLKGWRYLVFSQDQPVVAADLQVRGDQTLNFSNVNRGPFVESTLDAVRFAENLDVVQTQDFELRVLEISSLYLVALWLHGKEDLLIPLDPPPDEVEALTVYSEDEFIQLLRGAAETRLKTNNRPRQ
jgi:hypothetical protein